VRHAKQSKQREVPLHDSTTRALLEYSRLRDRRWPKPHTSAFFVSNNGGRLTACAVHGVFPKLIRRVGLEGHGERTRPRPHDLRHTFAVRTLLDWHRAGENVDARMPLLSTFLGHVQPSDTYWYSQTSPELLALISQRLDRPGRELS
jgi:integrase/recombinase XerD